LLVEDQKIRTLEDSARASNTGSAKQTTPLLDGIDVQAPVRELLAGFRNRLRGFYLGKHPASRIGHFADKLCHGLSVYLIHIETETSLLPIDVHGLNTLRTDSGRQEDVLFGLFHDGNTGRGFKIEKGFCEGQVYLPISEPIFQFDAARLAA